MYNVMHNVMLTSGYVFICGVKPLVCTSYCKYTANEYETRIKVDILQSRKTDANTPKLRDTSHYMCVILHTFLYMVHLPGSY